MMSDDNESLFELSMGNGPSLNQEYAKIEERQQALQLEINQGLHEPAVAKQMKPIKVAMQEDGSFERLSNTEQDAIARYAAEKLTVIGVPNPEITGAWISSNGDVDIYINDLYIIDFRPKAAYDKFISNAAESVPSITQPLERPYLERLNHDVDLASEQTQYFPSVNGEFPLESALESPILVPQMLPEPVKAVNQKIAKIDAPNATVENITLREFDEFIYSERGAELFNPESLAEIKSELEAIMPWRRQFK